MIFRPQRHLTLSTFRPSPRNARARAGCIDFIIDKCAPNPPVLVVAGQAQTGKTHLLNASTHLAKRMAHVRSYSILSQRRFVQEVELARRVYDDLPMLIDRFAAEDLLVIDDVDDIAPRQQVADVLLEILELRATRRKRTLLSATIDAIPTDPSPFNTFIDRQWAVRLD